MPQQELFFEHRTGDRYVEVLKSYDQAYAREAFESMDGDALQRLWTSLQPEETYDAADLPSLIDQDGAGEAFLWDELLEQAREDGSILSFFIVNETSNKHIETLFVSPDWPTAEAFAKERVAAS